MDRDEHISELLTKGVAEVFPSAEYLKAKLIEGRPLTIYLGFDPTAPSLHLGHAIQLRKLRQFQALGHRTILLMGDFTATIGDPDKLSVRAPLSRREVKNNLKTYKQQASRYLRFSGKNAASVKFNARWLSRLKFADILSLASHMTVDQLLKRDMFVRRGEEGRPVYLHEFLYPLMQGYDSVAMDVDGEIGGTDQTFNMLAGRTLMKQMKGKEKFVLTLKLLEDATGKKMGKTEGNAVSLTDSAENIYGKVMSWPDTIIPVAFELCTDLSMKEAASFLSATTHPKEQKMRLAFEIVKAAYGEKDAQKAETFFKETFQERKIPENVEVIGTKATLKETFLAAKVVQSSSILGRLADGGAIVNNSSGKIINRDDLNSPPEPGVYKIGKKDFRKIED